MTTKERDGGVRIDMFHGNVIFILNNGAKREYQELLGEDWKLERCHGTPWGTQHSMEIHSSVLKRRH